MRCVISNLILHSILFCLLISIELTKGQNDGSYYGKRVKGQSQQKAGKVRYSWNDQGEGKQPGEYKKQDGVWDFVEKTADKDLVYPPLHVTEKKGRKKDQQGKKIQVQVRNARDLNEGPRQENVDAHDQWAGGDNLLQQPLKKNVGSHKQWKVKLENVGNYQQPANAWNNQPRQKEKKEYYQQPGHDVVKDEQHKSDKNVGNYQQAQNAFNSQLGQKEQKNFYQQPGHENVPANIQHQKKEDGVMPQQQWKNNAETYQQGSYQVPVKQKVDPYQQPVQKHAGMSQQPMKKAGEIYQKPELDSIVNYNPESQNDALKYDEDTKNGKKKGRQRYRRNEETQQEKREDFQNVRNADSLNNKIPETFKETDVNKLEKMLLGGHNAETAAKVKDTNQAKVPVKEGYNVLPTIDNKMVVQQSQIGLTRRNRTDTQQAGTLLNLNPHGQHPGDMSNQDQLNNGNKEDFNMPSAHKMKQSSDALRNKNFDYYQKQSALDKTKGQLLQEQDSYGQKKEDDSVEKYDQDHRKAGVEDPYKKPFQDKFQSELREDEEKHKAFHVNTNIANVDKIQSDIAEAQRIIGSDFRKGNGPKQKTKPVKGPARPHPSQRKNVIWSEESQSYNLKLSADNQFRIGYAPLPEEGTPWPMPQFYTPGNKVYLIKPENFQLNAVGESCDILEFSMQRARMNMFGEDNVSSSSEERNIHLFREADSQYPEIKILNVTVLQECGLFPQYGMEESYDLEVRKGSVVLIAREVWGAIRGLETLTQLVYQNDAGQYLVNKTLIHDFPRFKHRGVLLDTSRHYLNKETIIVNLEAMAQNKMNVFHWHIVDEQAFPFESKTYPNLSRMGAYSPSHVYTPEIVADIINEARLRGIRVIPEFDTPGHTFSWGLGQDNLLTPCYDYDGQPTGYFGPINPILKSTYKFLQGLFSEVMSVFKDKFIHLGGDEVPLDCWQTNPFLERFLTRNQLFESKDLLNIYMKKVFDIIKNTGKSRTAGSSKIVWQEVFDNGVEIDKETVVQVWMGDAWDIDRITSQGHFALFSTCWYLNYISYGMDWEKYYKCDQLGSHLDMYNVRNQSLIMGGEVCLWTEFADDENILPRLWPRASAAAERLWSHKDITSPQDAAPRLEEQRCRMKRRGLPVGVLSGPGFCKKYPKTQQFKPFDWNSNKNKFASQFDTMDVTSSKHIYVVDVNSMYIFPLIVLLCIICLSILISLGNKSNGQKPFLAKFHLPGISSRKSVKGLVIIFMAFAFVWCIWTAPIWMHTWENKLKST